MPYMQAMVEAANEALNRNNIGTYNSDPKVTGLSGAVARLLGSGKMTAPVNAYLDSWPTGLQDTVLAAVRSAVARQLPVTMAWMPGYDFKVTVTEAAGIPASPGGMTIVLESKYP